jgi:hypothetical protein
VRLAWSDPGTRTAKAVVKADDVKGEAVQIGRTVAGGIGFAVNGFNLCKLGVIAEETQQGNHPEIAGFGGAVALAGDFFPAALKDAPQILGIGPGAGDLIFHLDSGIKTKILGELTGDIALLDPVQDVGGKNGAFDADGGVFHAIRVQGSRFGV